MNIFSYQLIFVQINEHRQPSFNQYNLCSTYFIYLLFLASWKDYSPKIIYNNPEVFVTLIILAMVDLWKFLE